MSIPRLQEIEFSPLMWKECIVKDSAWKTIEDFYSYFREHVKKQEWLKGTEIAVPSKRIMKLINGYLMFDILEWGRKIELSKFNMWQLFEDLVGEIFREALRNKGECTLVHVNGLPGFKGLDYVVTDSKKKEGWTVGIQCKRYIRSALPKSRLEEYESWSRGTSAAQLQKKGKEQHERLPGKKFVLVAFNAFRTKETERRRFSKLKHAWDCVMVFDKSTNTKTPYTYKIDLRELDRIVKWC